MNFRTFLMVALTTPPLHSKWDRSFDFVQTLCGSEVSSKVKVTLIPATFPVVLSLTVLLTTFQLGISSRQLITQDLQE